MKLLSKLALSVTAVLMFSSLGHAQSAAGISADSATAPDASTSSTVAPEKEAEIRKLLELTGTLKLMNQMMDQMMTTMSNQNPSIPAEFWTKFKAGMDTNSLIERLIPVYDKHYSLEDLKAINAFYQTPAGQHLVAALPLIMQESMQIGQQWGMEVGQKVEKQIQDEKASEK